MATKNFDILRDFTSLLQMMVRKDASDLFVTAGVPPSLKINGSIAPISDVSLSADQVRKLAYSIMNEPQRAEFDRTQECNFAIAPPDTGRFRANVFQQKNHAGIVLRRIKTEIPTFAELGIPQVLESLAMAKRGMVIIVGATGTGKSSTLASMIGHRNRHSHGHIITVEDPIEYVHEHSGCIITQREVGVDTASFEAALRNTLRQAPDVILIGEVRTRETMEHAIAFAETGHLCVTTLHANNANQALDRILSFFPKDRREQILLDLSLNLRAIVAQQLIPTPDQQGRCVAVEILMNTPLVAQMIRDGNVATLKDVMSKSNQQGMNTFDQALYELYKARQITYEAALHHADSANELRLMIKLGKKAGLKKMEASLNGVTLVNIDQL
ncbi:Type IV pilus assembly ATPase component PilU [hydrothermal vent metagenome]|uniref:Type IV pilus assembly ATPase component PilU n=1 Tax=hydrothermal vent metagenome TaxID=652676 RepID=A0A3B0ZPJ0_9ZZZZ